MRGIMYDDTEKYTEMMETLNIVLKGDMKQVTGNPIMKRSMQIGPVRPTLSHATSKKYHVENVYAYPMDDTAADTIRACDPNGPLMMHVSRMAPTSEKSRFYAFGRVFNGTIATRQKVTIQGPHCKAGSSVRLHCWSSGGVLPRDRRGHIKPDMSHQVAQQAQSYLPRRRIIKWSLVGTRSWRAKFGALELRMRCQSGCRCNAGCAVSHRVQSAREHNFQVGDEGGTSVQGQQAVYDASSRTSRSTPMPSIVVIGIMPSTRLCCFVELTMQPTLQEPVTSS